MTKKSMEMLVAIVMTLGAHPPLQIGGEPLAEPVSRAENSATVIRSVLWIEQEKTDWEGAYQKLLRENESVRKKVESGETTRDEVIQWLKVNRGAGDHVQHEKNWIDRNVGLFIILIQLGWIIPTVLIIAIVHVVVKRREERRTEALATAADEMGLIFKPEGDDAFHQSLPEFPLFQVGRKQLLKNLILADTPELKMGLFDYCFTVGHGKHKKVRKLSVVVVQSADLHAPSCHLRPQIAFWDPIGALFGKQDVNFADHPEFSKAFVLKTDSEEETRAFFDQGLLDFFIKHADISFETRQGAFLYFRQWKRVDPEVDSLRDFLGEGYAVLQALRDRRSRS